VKSLSDKYPLKNNLPEVNYTFKTGGNVYGKLMLSFNTAYSAGFCQQHRIMFFE